MSNTPPPYTDITGISRTVMKDNAQETLINYDGNARPGEIVADLTVDPPTLYIGNNLGQLSLISSGGNSTYGNTQVADFLNSGLVGNISASGNITGNKIVGNGSQLSGILYANISNTPPMVSPSNELHVAKNGNNTTGNGDVLNPYLTIGQALTVASNGYKIIVHAGEYNEDIVIANLNFISIASVDSGGISAFTPAILGNLTVSGSSTSTAIKNVGINRTITHSASGSLYLTDLTLGQSTNIGALNKTGSGYLSIQNCNLGTTSGVSLTNVNITGPGTVVLNNTQLAAVTVNNASASVSIVNNSNTLSSTLTAGTLNVFDSYMYTLGNSGFYAVNATGGVLQIRNSILINPNQTPAPVNLASPTVFAYDDIYFDRANSTLGISANAVVDFQSIRLSGAVSVTGNVTGNHFVGNGSQLTQVVTKESGTWTVTPGTANYSFEVPVNGVYQLWVRGNIPNGIVAYTATVSVTNTNVPVLGQQFAWNYEGGGNLILFTSIPSQITGTAGAISNASPVVGTTTNVFEFGIQNNTANNVAVAWGYTDIS